MIKLQKLSTYLGIQLFYTMKKIFIKRSSNKINIFELQLTTLFLKTHRHVQKVVYKSTNHRYTTLFTLPCQHME